MHLFVIVFALIFLSAMPAKAEDLSCQHHTDATLTGIIHSKGRVQEEPQASPQFHYDLELDQPWCGTKTLFFSVPHTPLSCFDGDKATVTGDLFPPSEPFNTPFFDMKELKDCKN